MRMSSYNKVPHGRSGSTLESKGESPGPRKLDSTGKPLPSFGRQGSLWLTKGEARAFKAGPLRGAKTNHSLHSTQRGHHDIKQLMGRTEDVYHEMERQHGLGALRIPLKFADFYNADIMFLFVTAAMQHVDSIVALKQHEKPLDAARVHAQTLGQLATSYSRVVLHCSNFERQKEDEVFFECVYYFVCAITKLVHPTDLWQTIEEELGYAFRGESFNVNGRGHLHVEPLPEAKPARFGQPVAATDSLKFVTASTTERYGAFIQMVGVNSIVARVDGTKDRVETNLRVAQTIRDRINLQHRAEFHTRVTQETEFQKRNAARMEVHGHVPAKPLHGASASGPFSPRLNMRATLDARSPVVARILPPPCEAGASKYLPVVRPVAHARLAERVLRLVYRDGTTAEE
ncbi:hypothetical protein ACHHYP_14171 [Achlya hypogyna]|uniref:Uncharacterized protein n=1 Tax=Achlya hypogyna TaxID=1202772 RepID=A0A1V9YDW5_ACHHY|nr:hypothetical protein ACHHYP_14171 [Achlya hypogyna]